MDLYEEFKANEEIIKKESFLALVHRWAGYVIGGTGVIVAAFCFFLGSN